MACPHLATDVAEPLLLGCAGQPTAALALARLPCPQDNDVALQSLVPPLAQLPEAARRAALRDPLLPLDVEGDRQYCLSPRYGALVDAPTLVALLAGRLPGQALHADGPGARAGNDGS